MTIRGTATRMVRRFVLLLFGMLTVAGSLTAQTPPDSLRRDSLRLRIPIPDRVRDSLRADSISRAAATGARRAGQTLDVDSAARARERFRQDSIRAVRAVDTIKAPLFRFESPPDLEVESRLTLNRTEILQSGAMYLADLLDRVPGVTSFRSGWLAGLHTSAYRGDFRRIRIFVDGVEFDAIDPRNDGVVDQVELPLWTLDAIEIERTPTEVRVWARSATFQRTTPFTRVDIFTGDLNTNAFRGIFMRRFGNGFALQVAGQQVSTQRGRVQLGGGGSESEAAGDGDQQAYNARIGWARGRLTIDGYATLVARRRDRIVALEGNANLPRYQGTRREGYFRVGFGDTASGPWALAMLSSVRSRLEGVGTIPTQPDPDAESVRLDTTRTRAQTVLGLGWRNRSLDVSLVDRIRGIEGNYRHSPAARASFATSLFDVGAYVERSILDTTDRAEVFARVTPTVWSSLVVSYAARDPDDRTLHLRENATRADAAIRVAGRWLGAGILRYSRTGAASPVLLGASPFLFEETTTQSDLLLPSSIATVLSMRGPVYRDLRLDMQAVRWSKAAFHRPQMQVYTELRLASQWLSRFPRGEFSIDARIRHEWRDPVSFHYGQAGTRTTERTQLFNGFLEIRIQQATLFYQYRNLTGTAYTQIPGIPMPPAVQLYGVRWDFWN